MITTWPILIITCLFKKNDVFIIIFLYIDNMLIVTRDASKIDIVKREHNKYFDYRDLRPAKQILNMKISHSRKNKKFWLS